MVDIASTAIDTSLTCWDRTANFRKYIQSLGDNLTALRSKMQALDHVCNDVNRLVSAAEGERWIQKGDVTGWLERVYARRNEAEKILVDGEQIMGKTCLWGLFYSNCCARYQHSKLAEAKRDDIETELVQGRTFRAKEDIAYEPTDLILKRSLEALQRKWGELGNVFETVLQRVAQEEDKHAVRTREVGGWLERVQLILENEVPEILKKGEEVEKSSQGDGRDSQSQRNCTSYHELSKHAEEKRATLEEELVKARGFTIFTYKLQDPMMIEIPLEPPVGLDSRFQEVWKWVEDENVRRIGLYGMGGVGKTTLLMMIHNKFVRIKHDYDVAAWIVVSQPPDPKKIQEAIFRKLHVAESERQHTSESERAGKLLSILMEKNFLLFLDDVWDQIDLLRLGIPSRTHTKKSKIIFTTRSQVVCGLMQADKTKNVECLPSDKALELFQEKVGEETWSSHVEIPKLAEDIVKKCENLPLALITVGASMASRKHLDDWKHAIKDLESRPSDFAGMERVFSLLEFSYDALPNETHKNCFLYCLIFPKDHKFQMDELIDLCIGEGFLNECGDIHEARDRGINVISSLRRACLLEEHSSSSTDGTRKFRMHDVIRDMALWVASAHGKKKNKIIVQKNCGLLGPKEVKKWNRAERISLWHVDQNIENFPAATMLCSNLSTLVLRNTKVTTFPNEFFPSMPSLRVLDLLGNESLLELPGDIGVLVNLRYLNLRWTRMDKLPLEIKSLKELVFLFVDRTCRIPKGVIPCLLSLRVFYWVSPSFNKGQIDEADELNVIEELHGMTEIDEVHLGLLYADTVRKLLRNCPHLQRCLGELRLVDCQDSTAVIIPKLSLRRMEHLRHLSISRCEYAEISTSDGEYGQGKTERGDGSHLAASSLESWDCFRSLKKIEIKGCHRLRDVTLLICHAPGLASLTIDDCPSMQELVGRDIDELCVNRIFSCLVELRLANLPGLECICWRALLFPSLGLLEVRRCQKLKQLPFDSSSARRDSLRIRGEKKWWDELWWDDDQTRQFFSNKFVILRRQLSLRWP